MDTRSRRGTLRAIARAPACAIAITLLAAGSAAAQSAGPSHAWQVSLADPDCGVSLVVPQSGRVAYRLPHIFLRPGSDTVWTRAGHWRLGVDYALDMAKGELRLLREPVVGDTMWVRTCWLSATLPTDYQLFTWKPGSTAPADSGAVASAAATTPRPVTERSPSVAAAGTDLTLTGNKSIAVDFGSGQDAFLRQSLDLTVSGTLAPGVELTGVLSDRDLPLGAAGATQDLKALDRVLIELKAPQGGAALGDVTLGLQRGEFARLERRLQGARGEWSGHGFTGIAAAASAQGEYHSMQFYGADGRQGPYALTDRDGSPFISVIAGSEVVTLDGVRLTRGESADYSMDYEVGHLTFTNRRPISSASRITVEYQFSVNRFRRSLAAGGAAWERGGEYAFTTFITEADDQGRPLGVTLDSGDRFVLGAAGDSSELAIGGGVVPGAGDYILVPAGTVAAHYAFAGVDSGNYAVRFARVGAGFGAYNDSALVQGRTVYAFVGQGNGTYRIGRPLPMPDSHQLWAFAAGTRGGPLAVDVEGALSRHDLNTYSALDDGDNAGGAGKARVTLAGSMPGFLGSGGLELQARGVGQRFDPFSRLERPFAQEDWGLPVSADIEHQRRYDLTGFLKPRMGGELRTSVGQLTTPDGFQSLRGAAQWVRDGRLGTRVSWERADGHQAGLVFADGGRQRSTGELVWHAAWFEPLVRGEWDERRSPSDTGLVGTRTRDLGAELRSPRARTWQALVGLGVRDEAQLRDTGYVDLNRALTLQASLETPLRSPWGASVAWHRRSVEPRNDPRRTQSDLASARLRAGDPGQGWSGTGNVEVTSEGENTRVRRLVYVGPGNGPYDALGNPVGGGDYDLTIDVSNDLARISRVATSARGMWQFGSSDAWRGSRIEADFETEARRRGDVRFFDAWLSPGAALTSADLERGAVTQRLESELAPGSAVAAFRLRVERRVSGDRSYLNFTQSLDQRSASARWRARPGPSLSQDVEVRWKRDEAGQALFAGAQYHRVLQESGGSGQWTWSPSVRARIAAVVDAAWSRADPGNSAVTTPATRTIRTGPDVDLTLGARMHAGATLRRAFVSGPPLVSLIPTIDPAGPPRWEASARADYRLYETTRFATTFTVRDRTGQVLPPARTTEIIGRVELRAFF